jgi:transposase-like protein
MPRPDFPHSIIEFQQWFPDEEACIKYLYESRWPDGFICPVCGDTEAYYITTRRAFKCKANGHQTYLTAGTVMHGSHTPLAIWFWTAYLVTTVTPGISAVQIQRQLGITYETAFNILHKLRSSMFNPERTKIKGVIEVDETYIGGPTTGGKRGRGTEKAIVAIAVERIKDHAGRVRLRHIEDVSESSLIGFIKDSAEKGSTIITDEFPSYRNINKYGYRHRIEEDLRLAHLVASNLKTWIKGIFHGVSEKHLQAYLNEFTFRFNRRRTPMAAFQTLLGLSSKVEDWPTYKELYSGKWEHPNPLEM